MKFEKDIEELLGPRIESPMAFGGGAHEGASRTSRELALWSPPLRSADQDILPDKNISDARVRDILRNDGYAQNGQSIHRDSIVGSMFLLNAKPNWKALRLDETWAEEFQEEVESYFNLWAESPENWVDASRHNTLTSMTRMAVGIHLAAGEVLASVEWLRDMPRPYHTAIQMIEVDRLSNPSDQVFNTNEVRGGVRINRWGAPVGYYIRESDIGLLGARSFVHKYIPARKPWGRLQMIHIVDQTRPGQTRGISKMVAALKEMKITKKFRDIVLQNAVVNATYAAAIESDLPSEAAFQALGGGNFSEAGIGEAITAYSTAYLAAISEYSGSARNMFLDGVKIPHLFPGTKLNLMPAGKVGGVGQEFETSLLRGIAANLDVSYEELSRDYSKTNYSSAKAAFNQTWRAMTARKRMVADRFASSIYRLWLEEAINNGKLSTMNGRRPSYYDGQNADAYSQCEWVGASRGQIDELKETQAAILRIKNNLSTTEDELAKLGKDWRTVYAQRSREKKKEEELEIQPVESNAINAASGAVSEANADNGDGNAQE